VPEEKIKILESIVEIEDWVDANLAVLQMIEHAGRELAIKLLEHGKVAFTKLPHERSRYTFSLEIIVPSTPERPFYAKPK